MLERNAVFNSRVEPDNFFYHRNERLVNYDRKKIRLLELTYNDSFDF